MAAVWRCELNAGKIKRFSHHILESVITKNVTLTFHHRRRSARPVRRLPALRHPSNGGRCVCVRILIDRDRHRRRQRLAATGPSFDLLVVRRHCGCRRSIRTALMLACAYLAQLLRHQPRELFVLQRQREVALVLRKRQRLHGLEHLQVVERAQLRPHDSRCDVAPQSDRQALADARHEEVPIDADRFEAGEGLEQLDFVCGAPLHGGHGGNDVVWCGSCGGSGS